MGGTVLDCQSDLGGITFLSLLLQFCSYGLPSSRVSLPRVCHDREDTAHLKLRVAVARELQVRTPSSAGGKREWQAGHGVDGKGTFRELYRPRGKQTQHLLSRHTKFFFAFFFWLYGTYPMAYLFLLTLETESALQ